MTPYYHDDGTEIDPSLYLIPELCLRCKDYNNPEEEITCTLNRIDEREDGEEFKCFAFVDIND